MPYLPQSLRQEIECSLRKDTLYFCPENVGELNFIISTLCHNYIRDQGQVVRYKTLNDCIGALECAKLELYRVVGGPLEDVRMEQNGPVYANVLDTEAEYRT